MDEFDLAANKIKNNFIRQTESDCELIKKKFFELVNDISESKDPQRIWWNHQFKLSTNSANYSDPKKLCNIDINNYNIRLEKITSLHANIKFETFQDNTARWVIRLGANRWW